MSGPVPQPQVGDLLVATAELLDPNFIHTVVLLLDLDEDGALGIVLNRPSTAPVGEVLADWSELAEPLDVLFAGGPVGTDSALALAASPASGGEEPVGFRRVFGDVGIVDLDTPVPVVGPALAHLRIFAGYAGWGEEQLRREIREGSWYVVPSEPGDLFGTDPLTLWKRVLRRQPGEMAWNSTRPLDPSMN